MLGRLAGIDGAARELAGGAFMLARFHDAEARGHRRDGHVEGGTMEAWQRPPVACPRSRNKTKTFQSEKLKHLPAPENCAPRLAIHAPTRPHRRETRARLL